MKERMRRIVCCVGTVGVMTIMTTVPAMAAEVTEDKNIDIEASAEAGTEEADTEEAAAEESESQAEAEESAQEEVQEEESDGYNWNDKVAANVLTYANIREGAGVESANVGRLPSGAVATVVGSEDGWLQITSGDVDGYVREDLVVSGEDARRLYEAMYGSSEVSVEATKTDPEAEAAAWAAAEAVQQEAVQQTSAGTSQEVSAEPAPESQQPAETAEASEPASEVQEVSVSTSELDLMAAIIECEAGGESYEGKIGVGAVIMNRIRSGEFPNTLSEVIYQSGQFEPVWTGKLSNVLARGASEACYEAARDVYAGANTIGDRLFFHAGSGSGLTIGNQTFY